MSTVIQTFNITKIYNLTIVIGFYKGKVDRAYICLKFNTDDNGHFVTSFFFLFYQLPLTL